MQPRFAFTLIFFAALRLAAQDVIVSGPSWVDPSDPPDTLPGVKMDTPDYPERLNGSTEIGYLVVDSFIFAQGKYMAVQRTGTNPLFYEVIDAAGNWRVKPAKRDGKPVNSMVRYTVIFNPACAREKNSDATPRLLSVVAPELPRQRANKNDEPPLVHVTATVDVSGQVTKAVADAGTPDELGQLAEDAVLKWNFAPARKNSQPVAQDVHVPVAFLIQDNLDAKADKPPRVTYQAPVDYPLEMRHAGLCGEVKVRFVVDIEGRVRNPFVISSTNPGLDQSAINGVLKWRFEPGLRHGVPVSVRVEAPIAFQIDEPGGGSEPYEVSDDKVDQSKLPSELRYDIPPKPANAVFAVYPFELLRDRVGGTVEVQFLVDPSGEVEQATVIKATRAEFGQAVLAMLDECRFQPAMKGAKPTWSAMHVNQEFSDFDGDVPVSDEARDLLHELKREKPAFCSPKNLDAPLQPLSRRAPVFPSALVGKVSRGKAAVEFFIDRDGNVQLPRVVSATDPAFGYAAAQGVSVWKFAPPTSHGKPVDTRARINIEFAPPAATTPASN
jgi:TonB family protein